MKSIITFIVCMTFALLLNAQTADSVKIPAESEIIIKKNTVQNDSVENETIFVEEAPQFPGGDQALKNYLGTNIKYPRKARQKNIQGTVFVQYVIEADGTISNVTVLKGIGGGCDEEAVRVVQSMPKWKPGTQRGKPVRTQYNMPVRFILN